jgi:4-alpha-glucanotransferase
VNRSSGILLHVTSLPSRFGIGDFGPEAYRFVDFLNQAGQRLWQILPLNPATADSGNSPYNSYSAFAMNPLFLSPEFLVKEGFLKDADIEKHVFSPKRYIDYSEVYKFKERLLTIVFQRCGPWIEKDDEFKRFQADNSYWLEDYALFKALKERFMGKVWSRWPEDIRYREPEAINRWKERLREKVLKEKVSQFLTFRQWILLKKFCNERGVKVFGDMPVYVSYDSADVWAHHEIFKLNEKREMTHMAGVPPDYFSANGQLWGNPLYKWEVLKERNYDWWIKRLEHNLRLFDVLRIDHFRGFVAYWEVEATAESALSGRWVEAPAKDFFSRLLQIFGRLPIIAEDLGFITPDVREIMDYFGFPGMKVLLFAFNEDNPQHPYLPHNYKENFVVYTGTHDTNTVVGWFRREATRDMKRRLSEYIGRRVSERNVHWEMIRLAMASVARIAIIPMQDLLGLPEEARMNLPSSRDGNWRWRVLKKELTSVLAKRLRRMTLIYGRL